MKKYIDKIFGIGKIKSDILTVVDGKKFTADRNGNQIYGTLKIKDEIKKNKLLHLFLQNNLISVILY